MKQWVEDILHLCTHHGPQTSDQLAAFVNARSREAFDATQPTDPDKRFVYVESPATGANVITKLRKQREVVVEVAGYTAAKGEDGGVRKRQMYLVTRKPAGQA
jgi:hypothetical protein